MKVHFTFGGEKMLMGHRQRTSPTLNKTTRNYDAKSDKRHLIMKIALRPLNLIVKKKRRAKESCI